MRDFFWDNWPPIVLFGLVVLVFTMLILSAAYGPPSDERRTAIALERIADRLDRLEGVEAR